jgi:hypothetical protein
MQEMSRIHEAVLGAYWRARAVLSNPAVDTDILQALLRAPTRAGHRERQGATDLPLEDDRFWPFSVCRNANFLVG